MFPLPPDCPLRTDAIALEVPGRAALSYGALGARTEALGRRLRRLGIRAGDVVAIAVPDGPEAVIALLGVMTCGTCAPLDPTLRQAEFSAALGRMGARLLVKLPGAVDEAARAARELGVPVLEWPGPGDEPPPGDSDQDGALPPLPPHAADPACPPDTALLLATSATTGRAKLVPLTRSRLSAMVASMRRVLPEADRGRVLLITPHFHLQCLLSMLIQFDSGGTIVSIPGFQPADFPRMARELQPTQYTANPTLHQAILDACLRAGTAEGSFSSLRFVSSAGAFLPDELRAALERLLRVPVVEGYGLTETGRVTMTPLDPLQRRAGSVGLCCGPEVGIMDEDGRLLGPGETGEVVLRGDTVFDGYAFDPDANAHAFHDGWFRTGDLGRLDADAFLYLSGRSKESIHRGAEKILPQEVEQVLSRHPAVKDVAVFAYPHPRLGEDVGACVVRHPELPASALELRRFAAAELAPHKVPRRLLFVDAIPRGATGKPQRARIAEWLKVAAGASAADPAARDISDPTTAGIARIWTELLGVPALGADDDFFMLGGDSLLATEMLLRLEQAFGVKLEEDLLVTSATLGALAAAVRKPAARGPAHAPSSFIVLRPQGTAAPLCLVHAGSGNLAEYRPLVRCLGEGRPVYGLAPDALRSHRLQDLRVEDMARRYVAALESAGQAAGCWLVGYSIGGLISMEMARQLKDRGRPPAGLILIDPLIDAGADFADWRLGWIRQKLDPQKADPPGPTADPAQLQRELAMMQRVQASRAARLARMEAECAKWSGQAGAPDSSALRQAFWLSQRLAADRYRPRPLAVRCLMLWCHRDSRTPNREWMLRRWRQTLGPQLDLRLVEGVHTSVIKEPAVREAAREVQDFLQRSEAAAGSAGTTPGR